jgi:hypothetical protein
LAAGYAAFKDLLQGSVATFGGLETAIGANRSDPKRYLEFGSEERADIPSALSELRRFLCRIIHKRSGELEAALLQEAGGALLKLLDRQRGPVLRLNWYPGGRIGPVNHPHTDIDLFTILPAASRRGFECRFGDNWEGVETGPSEVLVLPGDFLHYFGGLPAVEHRVITDGRQRMSASLFVNADPALFVEGHGRIADLFEARLAVVRQPGEHEGS